jgi:hypothetical protein
LDSARARVTFAQQTPTQKNTSKMKKHLAIISALSLCYFTSNAQLTYQTITSGFNAVSFEGGDSEIELGDIDGDGDLDIVTIGDHGSPNVNVTEAGIMVWKNNGSGTTWSLSKNGNLGYGGVALGDVNGDGKMDVAMGMHHNYATSGLGSQMMEVALGNGSGSSWTQSSTGLLGTGIWGMFAPDFGDVDNDGQLDIVCTPFSYDDGLRVYKNGGNGSNWVSAQTISTGNIINYNCKLADFNNDGNVDMMVSCQAGSAFKNNGQGVFSSMKTGLPADWTMKFATGDIDNNGSKDLAIVSSGAITTYKYVGSAWVTLGNTNLPATGAKSVALADMDMDGKCDLIAFMGTGIEIYKGDGTGNWTINGTIPFTIANVRGLAIGDLDHDGYSDIAYFGTASSNNSLKVFLHTVASPVLNVLSDFPKGFECFAPGSVQFVKWLSSVPAGPQATVTIELSTSGANGPWINVVSNAPNSGIYQWVLPNVTANNCYLKYTITTGSGTTTSVTPSPFGIGDCSTVTTGINETGNGNTGFGIYPNPFSEYAVIQITDHSELQISDIKIFDLFGKEIQAVIIRNSDAFVISSEGLPAGIYFCEIRKGKVSMTEKFVVVK